MRSVVDVTLPRPRRLEDLIESDDANVIKMHVLSLLHEAMKSFAHGSKAAANPGAYSKRIRNPEMPSRSLREAAVPGRR